MSLTGGADLPTPAALPPARRLFVIGDRDQFTTVDDLSSYAAGAHARLEVIEGSDHFFAFRDQKVGALLADHFSESE